MASWNKTLCLVIVICLLSVVLCSCKVIEGLQIDFNLCVDDPNWYVTTEDNERLSCSDIGSRASCYDRDDRQIEGWEACLATCGNCAETQVTQAPMNQLAYFSGDPIEDFGVVMFRDDDRQWIGRGAGDDSLDVQTGMLDSGSESNDIRNFLGSDESEDILDIYNRLTSIEGLYDMLLGSVESCVNCGDYDDNSCENQSHCEWNGEECVTRETTPGQFIGCRGDQLTCNVPSPELDDGSDIPDEQDRSHQYVKHVCDDFGNCNIQFPTYEFSCNEIPAPMVSSGGDMIISYDPLSINRCVTSQYLESNGNTPIEEDHLCRESKSAIEARPMVVVGMGEVTINPGEDWSSDDIVQVSGCNDIETTLENGAYKVDQVLVNDGDSPTFITLKNTDDSAVVGTTYGGCIIGRLAGSDLGDLASDTANTRIIENCYQLTGDELENPYVSCAEICNSHDSNNRYLGIGVGNQCYCLESNPLSNSSEKIGAECPVDSPIEMYSEGEISRLGETIQSISEDSQDWNDMCKQYFLLESSLVGDSEPMDVSDVSDFDTEEQTSAYPGRISLYDMCPRQCRASGCPLD